MRLENGEDMANPPEREVGKEMAGSQKLASLRERMKRESSRVLEYIERKKSQETDLILEDIETLWRQNEEDGKRVTGRREPEDLLPEGWKDWWNFINHQFSQSQRTEKISRAGNKKKNYQTNLSWVGEDGGAGWRQGARETGRRSRGWS